MDKQRHWHARHRMKKTERERKKFTPQQRKQKKMRNTDFTK